MDLKVKEGSKSLKTRIALALSALLGGLLIALLGQIGVIAIPLASSALAVIFLVEQDTKKLFSILTPVLLVALDLIFNGIYSLGCVSAIIVAILMFVAVRFKALTKSESALISTVTVSILVILSLFLFGCWYLGRFDFGAVMDSYRDLIEEFREVWLSSVNAYVMQDETGELASILTADIANEIYSSYVNSAISYVVVAVFLVIGLSYKALERSMIKHLSPAESIARWRFTLTPVYCWFYIAVYAMQLFVPVDDAFGLIVVNLANIMSFVFAYIGFRFADAYLRMRMHIRRSKLILIFALIMFSGISITLLSFVGVFATFMINRAQAEGFTGQGGNQA